MSHRGAPLQVPSGHPSAVARLGCSPPRGLCLTQWAQYHFRVHSSSMNSVHFIQIRPAVFELNHADRQTRPAQYDFISCTKCSHLRTCVPNGLFPSRFPTKFCVHFSSCSCVLHAPPISPYQHSAKSTSCEDLQDVIFSIHLLLPFS